MFCTNCGARNGGDANFCKQCGQKLDRAGRPPISDEDFALPPRPDEQVGDLMARAFRCHESGDLDGAISACAEALEVLPQSTSAHSMMSTLYEQKGERDKAISELEQVLALNPGSIADREKLEQLRNGASSPNPVRVTSTRRLSGPASSPMSAGIYAVAVFLFVLMVGALAVWAGGRRPRTAPPSERQVVRAASSEAAPFPQDQQLAQTQAQSPQPVTPYAQPAYPPYQYPAPAFTSRQPGLSPQRKARAPEQDATPPALVAVPPPERLEQVAAAPQPSTDSAATVHLPDPGPTGARQASPTAPPEQRNPGKIEIVVSQGSDTGSGAKASSGSTGGAVMGSMDSHSRQAGAFQAQIRGDYRTAIREYMKSLDGAADEAGYIHQMIAQCFQHLGENDSAIAHYNDAIAEYKRLVAGGHNVEVANRGIKTCQDGIKACQ